MIKKLCILLTLAFCLNGKAQIITTIAGDTTGASAGTNAGYSGDGGQATTAELNKPTAILFDNYNNMYFTDAYNNCIRMVNTAGIITTVAGTGTAGYSGDGGQATNASLHYPDGIAFLSGSGGGTLIIADDSNNCVRMINTSGIISTLIGNGTAGFSGDGSQATYATLNHPSKVVFDASYNLYISDAGNQRIRMVSINTGNISTIAGNGTAGYSGDGGQATAAELNTPSSIVFDQFNNMYFADFFNSVVRKVTTAGIITTIAGGGTGGIGDGGQATSASFNLATGLAFDGVGNLYIADYGIGTIRIINASGIINTIAGNGYTGYGGDGEQATTAELRAPSGLAFDGSGNLCIADVGNNVIRKVAVCNSILASYTLVQDTAPHTWDIYPVYSSNVINTRWYWGDGSDTLALYPSHSYSVAGRYNICVTGYSSCGDSTSFCQSDTIYRTSNSSMVYVNVKNSATTGISQISGLNSNISIYPNPSNGSFIIEPNSATKQTLQVYDVNGKLVLSQTINGKTSIDANNLNEGVYNISLQSNEGVVNKRLVIVR